MGTFTNHGWSTSSDEIPQPTSILLGRKLRANSEQPSKQQKPVPVKQPAAPERHKTVKLFLAALFALRTSTEQFFHAWKSDRPGVGEYVPERCRPGVFTLRG